MKKKIILSLLLSTIILNSCKEKEVQIVYVQKPVLTDSDTLKATMTTKQWKSVLNGIQVCEYKILHSRLDSLKTQHYLDTLGFEVNVILSNIQDSNVNPIFKK